MLGASILPFSVPLEAKRIWGIDPFSDEFILEHTRQVTALLRCHWKRTKKTIG